jgi:hypothetical protein
MIAPFFTGGRGRGISPDVRGVNFEAMGFRYRENG